MTKTARCACAAVALSCGVALPATAAAQSVKSFQFDPAVLPADYSQPVRMEVTIQGVATKVTLDFQPRGYSNALVLHDDGLNGDRMGGDGVYTAQLPVLPILAALAADDVHVVFIGFLNVFNGVQRIVRGNIYVPVYGSDVGAPEIQHYAWNLHATPHLVNIVDPNFVATQDVAHVTRQFYQWFGDDYDAIHLVSAPSVFANRFHFQVRNAVQGTGVSIFDSASTYGSPKRLVGISRFPLLDFFDGAQRGYIHEFGHQWINFLNFVPFASGRPHWPLSTMAQGIMGLSIGGAGGEGGDYRCDIQEDTSGRVMLLPGSTEGATYNDLDLYLMGLLPADQVRQQIVLADQVSANQACLGQTYTGGVVHVGAAEVIAQLGPRVPAAGDAPTNFRIANILVTRDGPASQETMWLFDWLASRAELRAPTPTHSGFVKEVSSPFYVATGGRGTFDTTVTLAPSGFSLVASPNAGMVTSGDSVSVSISAMPLGPSFDAYVNFGCSGLPKGATCAFQPPILIPGPLGADTVLTIATSAGNTASPEAGGAAGAVGAVAVIVPAWGVVAWRRRRPSRGGAMAALGAAGLLLAGLGAACLPPEASKTTTPPPSNKTPAGTYYVTVTGNSGGKEQITIVTLIVK